MATSIVDGLDPSGIMWIASSGGHIRQAVHWSQTLGVERKGIWVVSGTPQTRNLLDGYRAYFLNQVRSREVFAPLRFLWGLLRITPWQEVHTIISTGASVAATSLLFFSVFTKKRVIFIESLTRIRRPSLSGRIVASLPRIELYSPHSTFGRPWVHINPELTIAPRRPRKRKDHNSELQLLVLTGTTGKPVAKLERLLAAISHPGDKMIVQGHLAATNGPSVKRAEHLSRKEIKEAIDWADVVLCHAGVGTVLDCLERGVKPIVIPREAGRREHVDDHQSEFAVWLSQNGLAFTLDSIGFDRDRILRIAGGGT